MNTKGITYLLICLSVGQLLAQELRPMPLDLDNLTSKAIDFNFDESTPTDEFSVLSICDMYTLQLANYEQGNFVVGINSRLEEELPYENNSYDFSGFYYLDLGLSYAVGQLSLGLSIENVLNIDNNNFSIDPILEGSNGIIDHLYFSHETDTILKFMIAYRF
ncbi:hypothetical protein [Psychroserpens sp.]|uniref:hypothetical protein n=1 Tax=Psychroserpens sp. TaxID=2020870 RepID=UPI002B264A6A|nr:hypothetical protein [Psychroserpens sp.]